MKHPSNREFHAYWNDKRGAARAPDRSEVEPSALRGLLGDIFVLSYDATAGHPFRVAGTRVCARLGCDLPKNGEREDYMRAVLSDGPDGPVATPLPDQDSSLMAPLAKASCLVIRAPQAPGASAGSPCVILKLGL